MIIWHDPRRNGVQRRSTRPNAPIVAANNNEGRASAYGQRPREPYPCEGTLVMRPSGITKDSPPAITPRKEGTLQQSQVSGFVFERLRCCEATTNVPLDGCNLVGVHCTI